MEQPNWACALVTCFPGPGKPVKENRTQESPVRLPGYCVCWEGKDWRWEGWSLKPPFVDRDRPGENLLHPTGSHPGKVPQPPAISSPCYQCRIGVSCFPACLPSCQYFSLFPRHRKEADPSLWEGQGLGTLVPSPSFPRERAARARASGHQSDLDPPPSLSVQACFVSLLADANGQFFLSLSPSSVFLLLPHLAFGPLPFPSFWNFLLPGSLIYSFDKHFKGTYFRGSRDQGSMGWAPEAHIFRERETPTNTGTRA